jgi:hypothetical protein
MLTPRLFPRLLRSFLVTNFRPRSMLDLKDAIDFFERKPGGLDVEEPDDRDPAEVEDGEDDVEAPLDGFDTWVILVSRADVEGSVETGLAYRRE